MQKGIGILLGTLALLVLHPSGDAQSHFQGAGTAITPAVKALASDASEVKAKSRIVVLLPSKLPQSISEAEYAVVQSASENEYSISLYYELEAGLSGFAASFSAEAHPEDDPKDIPNVSKVQLTHHVIGYFRPVSCGGSCAPANLWWEQNGILYLLQLRLPSTLPERDQKRAVIAATNSAIVAGPR